MLTALRSTLFNLLMYGTIPLGSVIVLALARFAPARVLPFAQAWARAVVGTLRLVCGIRLRIEGENYLPRAGGPALIAAQHQSAYDTMIWLALLPRPSYVLKHELLKLPLFGPTILPAGHIAVDRNGGMAAMRKLVEDARRAMADGRQIVIFPEGTRVAPGKRGALQPGIVALARALNLPVIPVGTDSGLFWGRKAYLKHPGTLRIRAFPALPPTMRRPEMLAALAARFYGEGVDNSVGETAPNFGASMSATE